MFRVDSVLMWLAEGDRVFVRAGCNAFPPGSRSACCHLLVPDKQVLVVPDTATYPRRGPCYLGFTVLKVVRDHDHKGGS